jgi:hypothetical protein
MLQMYSSYIYFEQKLDPVNERKFESLQDTTGGRKKNESGSGSDRPASSQAREAEGFD